MATVSFSFSFFDKTANQRDNILANAAVEVFYGDKCLVRSRNWQVINGKNGPFIAAPSYKSVAREKTGKDPWVNRVEFWPRAWDANGNPSPDTADEWKAFQQAAVDSYNSWVAAGKPNNRKGTDSPVPQQKSSQAPQVSVPAGWSTGVDTSGKKYYLNPTTNNVYFEGTPELAAALAAANTSPATTNQNQDAEDPFAAFTTRPGA